MIFGKVWLFLQFRFMNYDEPPFKYEIPVRLVYFTDSGDEIINPETNRAFFKRIEIIEFSNNLNGIKNHPLSGGIRDCLAKLLFKTSYIHILDNPDKNNKFHNLLKIYLRTIVIHYNYYFKGFSGLYITSNNGEVFGKNEDLKKIKHFIDSLNILDTNFELLELKARISIKDDSKKNIPIKLNLDDLDLKVKLHNQIFSEIKEWIGDSNTNGRSNLTNFCINYLKQENISQTPYREYLEKLKFYIDLLSSKIRDDASVKRHLKSMICLSNTLLSKMYFYINKTHKGNNGITKHLIILHTLSALGIISEFETIYKSLYGVNSTKISLQQAISNYMKNKYK